MFKPLQYHLSCTNLHQVPRNWLCDALSMLEEDGEGKSYIILHHHFLNWICA